MGNWLNMSSQLNPQMHPAMPPARRRAARSAWRSERRRHGRGQLGIVAYGALALALLTAAIPLRDALAGARPAIDDPSELALFPSGRWLQELSLGHPQLLADVAWLEAIQYYGKHRQTDRRYPLSPHLFSILTEADPQFESAYLFAALVMSEGGFLEDAERLLQRGVDRNPDSWKLRFELGFFQYVALKDYRAAAENFYNAAQLEGAAPYAHRFAAAAYEKAGDPQTAKVLWSLLAESTDNEEVRRMAAERLAELESGETR